MKKRFTLENPWWFWISAIICGCITFGVIYTIVNAVVQR
jgi:uncharacterized phage infection (PIP) family protein YhgE